MNEIKSAMKKELSEATSPNASSKPCCGVASASDLAHRHTRPTTQLLKALYHRLTPSRNRETPAMNPLTNPANAPALQAERSQRAQRVLARVRQRQLELALRGQVAESARYARRAQRVRCKATQTQTISACCAA